MPPKSFLVLFQIFSFFLILTATSPSFAQEKEQYAAIRLLPEKTQISGGETITVGIHHTLKDGWHTYWVNAGDSGSAARIEWSGLEKIEAKPILWPTPKKLPMGPLMNFGYEGEVILLQDITLPESLPEGPQEITASVDVLVCHEICIPESHTASFIINGDEEGVPAAIEMARTKLPLDMGWQANIHQQGENVVVAVETDMPGALNKLDSIELYPEDWGLIANPETTKAALKDGVLTLTHKKGERSIAEVPVTKIVIAYDDPQGDRKSVRVSALSQAVAPEITPENQTEDVGIVKAIFLALLGGIILNLMPCVFPVLSMKALSLVQLKDKEITKARLHGLAYTAGILASFAVIAGFLLALKAGGMQVGWGFQLQHPAVILFLTYLLFSIGLNLSGFFEIHNPFANAGNALAQKTGITGSFFTGVLATLVATPCTAPFMGAAMGYALTQSALVSMSVFMALGFGLALPYLALCLFPALRHALPKPGAWMETFRQFLAFPMFVAACWMFWVLSQQIGHIGQFAALLGIVAIALGLWLWQRKPDAGTGKLIVMALAGASFLFTLGTFGMMKPMPPQTPTDITINKSDSENWMPYSRSALELALEGKDPVFVNMTAAWCITCKVNEKVALSTAEIRSLFAEKNIQYFKGDWTNQNPEITNYLEEYGRSGVPIYVYYGPRDDESGVRPEAVLLPQILTPGLVKNTLNL